MKPNVGTLSAEGSLYQALPGVARYSWGKVCASDAGRGKLFWRPASWSFGLDLGRYMDSTGLLWGSQRGKPMNVVEV